MAFQSSGVDIQGLKNIEPIQFNISTDFLVNAPRVANEISGGWLGMIISLPMFIFLIIMLADKSEFARFRYTNLRATGLGACVVSVLGIVAVSVGFFNNYYHIVIFLIITTICTIWVYLEER